MHRVRLAHDRPAYAALRAGTRCVCCSADAGGRRAPYHDPDRPMFSVPVCLACTDHALGGGSAEWTIQLVLVTLGVLFVAIGVAIGGGVGLATGAGALFVAGALGWRAVERRRLADMRRHGHHPGLEFEIGDGHTTIATTNARLVDDLMSLHPTAHVRSGDELPNARTIRWN